MNCENNKDNNAKSNANFGKRKNKVIGIMVRVFNTAHFYQ